MIQNFGLVMNNRRYTKNVCYNVNMIDLTEEQKIKEFKTQITKTIINLIDNHNQYNTEEFCNCEEIGRTIRLLINIKTLLESL